MTYVVTAACIDVLDRSCLRECPVDCLYEGDRMMYIHPAECIECGACEAACPQEAIHHVADLPDTDTFRAAAEAVFAETGWSGGAAEAAGQGRHDAPAVARLRRTD